MTNDGYTKFGNDDGVLEIRISVKEFNCIGASPPHDHPHIYLYIGDDEPIRCPYCATVFRFDPSLRPWPSSRDGATRSRTRSFNSTIYGNRPSSLRDQRVSPPMRIT